MKIFTSIQRFFKIEWFGVFALIVGVFLSFYSMWEAKKEREPAFYVTKNVGIFSSPQGLSSEYFSFIKKSDGSEVTNNVYLMEASFWNKGKEAIRADDILDPIIIKYNEDIEIIDAFVATATRRSITKPLLKRDENKIELTFRILENEDSIGVQILYSAKSPAEFSVDGAILGVKSILKKEDLESEHLIDGGLKSLKATVFFLLISGVGLVLFFGFLSLLEMVKEKSQKVGDLISRFFLYSFLLLMIFLIVFLFVAGIKNNARKSIVESIPVSEQIIR